jgi:hypothetical protein
LWRVMFTGAFLFENDGIIKIVYFKGGDVLSASTNDRADSVDEILMRAGKVSKEHVKQALAKRKENETLGDALLNLGFITRKELAWARRIQVINVIRSVDDWEGGNFTVVADYLPKRDEGTQYSLPQILVEMTVTDPDRQKFEKALDSGSVVFEKAVDWRDQFSKLGLDENAEAIMAQVDGFRSASEVASAAHQETFNAFKLMHALSILGILQRQGPAVVPPSIDAAGVEDAADAWDSPAAPAIPAAIGGGGLGQFTLDDEPSPPTLSIPTPEPEAPSISAMPSWETPAAPPPAVPVDIPPPSAQDDSGFGFDLGQVEAVRKTFSQQTRIPTPAATPIPPPVRMPSSFEGTSTRRRAASPLSVPKKQPRRYGMIVAIMAIFIVAAGAYYGYTWWAGREQTPAPVVATPVTQTQPATATTASQPPAPTPATMTLVDAAPVPVPQPPAPQPRVQPVPAPVPVPATGHLRERYDAMAREFAANPSGNFTVQFAIVCEPSNVTKALNSSAASRVWFIPIAIKGRSCYRMFWGGFATRPEAEAAMAQLPGELRESKPAVVTVPR